jgi:RNA polymerase sigma factor for flagellar operon FliA
MPEKLTPPQPNPEKKPTPDLPPPTPDQLYQAYQNWAIKLASQINLSPDIEPLVDRSQLALIALWQASQAYDPWSGTNFKTYATPKINGAILDEARRLLPLSRTVSQRAILTNNIKFDLYQRRQTWPNTSQVTQALNDLGITITQKQVRQTDHHLYLKDSQLSLEQEIPDIGRRHEVVSSTPLRRPTEQQALNRIQPPADIVNTQLLPLLTSDEQQMVDLYYFQGKTMKQISVQLNVSEGKISLDLKAIREKLKNQLAPEEVF